MNRFLLAIILTCFTAPICHADERLWLDAKINGKHVRLCFDSGSEAFILWREGALRLGLKFTEPPTNAILAPGEVPMGITEPCTLLLEGTEGKTRFRVAEVPSLVNVDFDGVIGWWGLRHSVLQIDASAKRITFLDEVPKKTAGWTQLGIVTNSDCLALEIPRDGATNGIIWVDTGSDSGVTLPPSEWLSWKAAHPHQPMTFNSFFTPADGVVAKEEAWADRIFLGPLVLTNVPVSESTPGEVALGGQQYEGTLGLAALKHFDLIIDGEHGMVYLRPNKKSPPPYPHNRLGAAFVPATSQSGELIAKVIDGSPAQEAGIRNGDILLKVDKLDVSVSNIDGVRKFWMPAGTKLELTLKRGDKDFTTIAVLRNILPPDATKPPN